MKGTNEDIDIYADESIVKLIKTLTILTEAMVEEYD